MSTQQTSNTESRDTLFAEFFRLTKESQVEVVRYIANKLNMELRAEGGAPDAIAFYYALMTVSPETLRDGLNNAG